MIVKNEEEVLARCLESVKDAVDEIIIVDTGSTDRTKEIALGFTDKVYDFEWTDDFAAARNEAFGKAAMDYQMWLDADDVVPPESVRRIIGLKAELTPDVDVVSMTYITHFDEDGVPIMNSTRERLLRRERGYRWKDPVHEYITLSGNIHRTDIEIWHKKTPTSDSLDRNITIYRKLRDSGAQFTPRQQYYFARELKEHREFEAAIYYFERFLDEGQGWVEDSIASCYNLSICYGAVRERAKILSALLRSFLYAPPRAEICCEIGYFYKNARDFANAIIWFRIAAGLERQDSAGFVLWDYRGYIPNIEMCVCYSELGNFVKANECNELAAGFKPDSASVAYNREYFAGILARNPPEVQ
jgi:glycosyltransferase involved in cell wall biosynthesis